MKKITLLLAGLLLSANALADPILESDLGEIETRSISGTAVEETSPLWWSFDVGSFSTLVINTVGSVFDTELGLYDALGNLIAENDDNFASGAICGGFSCSQLSFSSGGLSAGTYFLALGRYPTSWGSTGFNVSTNSFSGNYTINFRTDNVMASVPEPGTLALLGLGLVGLAARRRKTV